MSFASACARLRREYGRPDASELAVAVAAVFLNGGAPSFARAFDRRGAAIASYALGEGETLSGFRQRVRREARGLAGAARIVVGGIGDKGALTPAYGLPRSAVTLPDIPLHPNQRQAIAQIERSRRVCLVCGRRWGKSTIVATIAIDYALSGRNVGGVRADLSILAPAV
jgi:hypothetical protein